MSKKISSLNDLPPLELGKGLACASNLTVKYASALQQTRSFNYLSSNVTDDVSRLLYNLSVEALVLGYNLPHADSNKVQNTQNFVESFDALSKEVHATAVRKGWWAEKCNDAEKICLMHSELSEAIEILRVGDRPSQKTPGMSALAEELADVVIRVMDYARYKGLNLAEAILYKGTYNKTRSYRHGGKKF